MDGSKISKALLAFFPQKNYCWLVKRGGRNRR
ncbi:Hypothetical protein Minf_2039 [Methylacidiphilum infernorum V4]|uniref:Uncharacterized protein n=1 Tax=Methylacidiphilum infernorum (isolate V4) TaxID=481448 RepID=B3DZ01_METI4|nr:Hypothetical protein Minf_2039 [Methylacidiphilum infernorum V4]